MYTLHASSLAEYFLSSQIMDLLLVTENFFQKKVTMLHVRNFVTLNSWKHVEFAVILVGTPFKTI